MENKFSKKEELAQNLLNRTLTVNTDKIIDGISKKILMRDLILNFQIL